MMIKSELHASKHGPMYRVEKWCSPYLSTISQSFCGDEFILDRRDLLRSVDELNKSNNTLIHNIFINNINPKVILVLTSRQEDSGKEGK